MISGPKLTDRVLVLAPTGRDAVLACEALAHDGLESCICDTIATLCSAMEAGAGTAIIMQEALSAPAMASLREVLDRQPPWSDFPLLVFTSPPSADLVTKPFTALGPRANVTLIERPIRIKTMITATEAALRARRRQYEVRDLVNQLEERVRERDQFLAMLSHELRNPLAAISLALGGVDTPVSAVEHDILVRQTRHLTKLVDDLLDIGRVTSGKIVLHRNSIDFADIVEHCVETTKPRAAARNLMLQLHTECDRAVMYADPVRIEQIVSNLLSNAIKYTPSGGTITVTLDCIDEEAVLSVRDSGKGISPELLNRIFDLFMQGDVTIDRSEGGMGIGLTLVRKLAELHGGNVQAYSSGRGTGSEFVVRLPLRDAKIIATLPEEPPAHATDMPRHIVIVEDNRDVRDLLLIKLRHLGHRVDAADDGLSGIEAIVTARPDIALIDIGLPGIDGYEVARQVRAKLGTTPYLVALTGYGQADDRQRALDAGFDIHLTKPADLADLQRVLVRANASAA